MAYINAEEMYQWYVDDVIHRNEAAHAYKKQCEKYCDTMPLENVQKFVKDFYELERAELGEPKKKTDDNDFEMFQKNIRVNVIFNNFADRPETKAVLNNLIAARENGNEKTLNEIVNGLYAHFNQEINEKKLEEKVWRDKLVYKFIEVATRKIVNQDFNTELDSQKDKGNCTKGITVSLERASEKFGISLFPPDFDKESLAHPKDIAREMQKYIKSSESRLLKDVSDVKAGDIVLLLNGKGEPRHAMMVSGFNELGEPLLLGFTSTDKNVQMFESKSSGEPRKGIVIDVHSFIKDKVNEHNRAELSQIMFGQKNLHNR